MPLRGKACRYFLCVAQGPFWFWQKPARWVAHFLFWASKKENAWQKKEDAQGKPQGFPCESLPYRGAAAPQTPGSLFFWYVLNRKVVQFSVTLSFWFVSALDFGSFTTIFVPSSKLSVLFRRRANFLWKFLFAGASNVDGNFLHTTANPPQGLLQSKSALRR